MTQATIWTSQLADARFSDPHDLTERTTRFERTIRRRNLVEYAAGALLLPAFAAMAIFFASRSEWALAGVGMICLSAVAFVLAKLFRDGGSIDRVPERSCREHLRAQYVRQHRLLASVPSWYLAPLAVSVSTLYAVVLLEGARRMEIGTALEGIWLPFTGTAAFFLFVGWLNVRAARTLAIEIARLDALDA